MKIVLGGNMNIQPRPDKKCRLMVLPLFLISVVVICAVLFFWEEEHKEAYSHELSKVISTVEHVVLFCEAYDDVLQNKEEVLHELVKNLTYLEMHISDIALLYGNDAGEVTASLFGFIHEISGKYLDIDQSAIIELGEKSKLFLSKISVETSVDDFIVAAKEYGDALSKIDLLAKSTVTTTSTCP